MWKKPRERANIILAVGYDVSLFLCAEWWPFEDAIAHFLLAHDVNFVFEKIAQRPANAKKPFFAISALDGAVVHVMSKLKVRVERAGRLAPIARNMKAELGRQHVANDQSIAVEAVGRKPPEFILPEADKSARAHLQRHQAERRHGVAVDGAVR